MFIASVTSAGFSGPEVTAVMTKAEKAPRPSAADALGKVKKNQSTLT
jgi:hypothetical protein